MLTYRVTALVGFSVPVPVHELLHSLFYPWDCKSSGGISGFSVEKYIREWH